jgi:hypothetical protein
LLTIELGVDDMVFNKNLFVHDDVFGPKIISWGASPLQVIRLTGEAVISFSGVDPGERLHLIVTSESPANDPCVIIFPNGIWSESVPIFQLLPDTVGLFEFLSGINNSIIMIQNKILRSF